MLMASTTKEVVAERKVVQLDRLPCGCRGVIVRVRGAGAFRKRILEMGFVRGQQVELLGRAPLGDPSRYRVMGYEVSLRAREAQLVDVEVLPGCKEERAPYSVELPGVIEQKWTETQEADIPKREPEKGEAQRDHKRKAGATAKKLVRVALVGNPNSGKTSIFNLASGAREHTGNYSGVTIDSRTAHAEQGDYRFAITDLPGTYSLTAYTPEELYVREFILQQRPDLVINVVDAANLERNLYLTLQLLETGCRVVVVLNMWDELRAQGHRLNRLRLAELLGAPCVPTVGRTGEGIEQLFAAAIALYEGRAGAQLSPVAHYGKALGEAVVQVRGLLAQLPAYSQQPMLGTDYFVLKVIESDPEEWRLLEGLEGFGAVSGRISGVLKSLEEQVGVEPETYATDARYDFLHGVLGQTFAAAPSGARRTWKARLDAVLMHRIWGLPLFFGLMWFMFWCTFTLGEYPMELIEDGVAALGDWLLGVIPAGPLSDLLVGGIINGVGSVIVFLPQILILFFFIALLEDTGYMARAVFLMDRFMQGIGLHGRSFIPLVMGFGCNVPAIMATRTIEDRKVRLATMLINPFMSCSARLQVYVLLASTMFVGRSATVLFGVYMFGILVAVLMSFVFRRTLLRGEDSPFVMELPPYRVPTLGACLRHMWTRAVQYLQKMGTVILLASILIWFLGYFPRDTSRDGEFEARIAAVEARAAETLTGNESDNSHVTASAAAEIRAIEREWEAWRSRESFLGRVGQFIEPAILPLGFDWRIGVGLVSGVAAKEVVVSTLGVLIQSEGDMEGGVELLKDRVRTVRYDSGPRAGELLFTPLSCVSLLLFVLLYVPCIAVVAAIRREAGSWKWAIFAALYTTALAYLVSLAVYQIGSLFL